MYLEIGIAMVLIVLMTLEVRMAYLATRPAMKRLNASGAAIILLVALAVLYAPLTVVG